MIEVDCFGTKAEPVAAIRPVVGGTSGTPASLDDADGGEKPFGTKLLQAKGKE